VDGLQAEREQGITIDVAYRYFSTAKRKFIISDTPGHEQYTRNMATGASTCDLAIILIDARKGGAGSDPPPQLYREPARHQAVRGGSQQDGPGGVQPGGVRSHQLGVPRLRQEAQRRHHPHRAGLGPGRRQRGEPSDKLAWYQGETLLSLLESAEVERELERHPVRLPVQYVNRPNLDFRGFAGTSPPASCGWATSFAVLPSGKESTVTRIVTFDGDLEYALPGQAITVTFADDEIDISRGDLLVDAAKKPQVTQNVLAHIVWMGEESLQPGRVYDVKLATKKSRRPGGGHPPPHRDQQARRAAASELKLNEIGLCEFSLTDPVAFDPYDRRSAYRQLHPHRPADQRHRRCRHDRRRPARQRQ
jgi:sulfate adenylyltransferase subunit 1